MSVVTVGLEELQSLLIFVRRRRDENARRMIGRRRLFVGVPSENFDELAVLDAGLAAFGLAVESKVERSRRGVAVPGPDELPGTSIRPCLPAGDLGPGRFRLAGEVEPNAARGGGQLPDVVVGPQHQFRR